MKASEFFKPFLAEGFQALKDLGPKLGDDIKWYLNQLNKIEASAKELVDAMDKATPGELLAIKAALATLIPDQKVFLLAAAEAEAGTRAQAILDAALDISGRLIAVALSRYFG